LPTLAGLKTAFAPIAVDDEGGSSASKKSSILNDKAFHEAESSTNAILRACHDSTKFERMMEHMLSLGPSATDLAIRSLETFDPAQPYLGYFAEFLLYSIETNSNFEMLQSYLQVFLQVRRSHLVNFYQCIGNRSTGRR